MSETKQRAIVVKHDGAVHSVVLVWDHEAEWALCWYRVNELDASLCEWMLPEDARWMVDAFERRALSSADEIAELWQLCKEYMDYDFILTNVTRHTWPEKASDHD